MNIFWVRGTCPAGPFSETQSFNCTITSFAACIVSSGGSPVYFEMLKAKRKLLALVKTSQHSWSSPTLPCCVDDWNHVVLTWSPHSIVLYLNGSGHQSTQASVASTPLPRQNNDVIIGSSAEILIDEMIFMDEAITSTEAQALFHAYGAGSQHRAQAGTRSRQEDRHRSPPSPDAQGHKFWGGVILAA